MGFFDFLFGKSAPEPEQVWLDTDDLNESQRSQLIWALSSRGGDACEICETEIRAGAQARASITAPARNGDGVGLAHADCFINRYGEEAIANDGYWGPTNGSRY